MHKIVKILSKIITKLCVQAWEVEMNFVFRVVSHPQGILCVLILQILKTTVAVQLRQPVIILVLMNHRLITVS